MITEKTFRLDGKIILVTGASEGIGEAVAEAYAASGATVILSARRMEKLEEVKSRIEKSGGKADCYRLDVSNVESIKLAKAYISDKYGRLDVLHNNAAFTTTKPAQDVSEEEWDKMIDIGLKGTYFMCITMYDLLKKANPGKIVNTASTASSTTIVGRTVYGAYKAGIERMTGSLAVEWAADHILVNAIAPTAIMTPSRVSTLTTAMPGLVARIPLGRIAQLDDVMPAVVFLASPASDFITGQTIYIDGGWSAW